MGKTSEQAFLKGMVRLSRDMPQENAQTGEKGQENAAEKPRRFELAAHSGNTLDGWFGDWIIDLSGMRFEEKIPVLLEHKYDKPVGVCDSVGFDGEKGLMLTGYFCETEEAEKIISLLEQGFPYQVSIGVEPEEVLALSEREKAVVNNKTVDGPVRIWTKSYVREASFTALGWDSKTSATLLTKGENMGLAATQENMGKNKGVSLGAGQAEHTAEPVHTAAEQMILADGRTMPKDSLTASSGIVEGLNLSAEETKNAVLNERSRVSEITALCVKFGLTELSAKLIERGESVENARKIVLENLSAQNPALGSVTITEDETDKFKHACVDGLALSMGYRKKADEKLAPGCSEFRNLSFQTLGRSLLERNGVKTASLSKVDIAERILGRRNLSAATDDFKAIFMDAMNKVLISTYENITGTWRPFVDFIPAADFKEIHGIEISGGSDLEQVGENAEYKIGRFMESEQKYAPKKYGRIFEISFEMVINDDMSAFRKMPMAFAAIAARNNSNVIYGLLNGNAHLADGKPLFSAERNNIGTAAGGLTSENLDLAADLLSAQKGMQNEILGLTPAFLLCSPADQIKAKILLNSASLPEKEMSSGVYNPWSDSGILPVVEERLRKADDGKKYFYLLTSPMLHPVLAVSFLNGKESPDIVEDEKFTTDGIAYKVRNIMGAGIVSPRGIVRMEIQ